MPFVNISYTRSGHIFMESGDDPEQIVDVILETGYEEEYCIATELQPLFAARMMAAGFIVMSEEHWVWNPERKIGELSKDLPYILLPKIHTLRSVLFFPKLHIKQSIRRLLKRYELRFDSDFDLIIDNCVKTHGDGWLTKGLLDLIRQIRQDVSLPVRPVSFGLYRDGELKAGEFGIISGRVYTSYSGCYSEANAGTVQIILMCRWLEQAGFAFLDLGMPLDYKESLGAVNVDTRRFVELFRNARRDARRPLL